MVKGIIVYILDGMQLIDDEKLSVSANFQSEGPTQQRQSIDREVCSSVVPAILRPCPFPALFKQQESPKQSNQVGFSGVFNLSNKQIYHAVRALRKAMRELSTPLQYNLIYHNYPNLIRRLTPNPNQQNLGIIPSEPIEAGPVFCRHVRKGKLESEVEQRKCKQKRIVVRAFCGRGFGEQALAEEMREGRERCKIFKADYGPILMSAITDTLRRMEQFLAFECNRRINLLTMAQLRAIYATLLDCSHYFNSALCQVWFRMMRSACGLATEHVSEYQVLSVYSHMQHLLINRISTKSICIDFENCYQQMRRYEHKWSSPGRPRQSSKIVNMRAIHNYRLHTVWRRQYEEQLIQRYKLTDDFQQINRYFRQTYPHLSHHFTSQCLKSRLLKLCELALRKVKVDAKGIMLSEVEVKMLIHEARAWSVRKALLDYYRNNQLQRESSLQKIIDCLKEYLTSQQPKLLSMRQLYQSVSSDLRRKYHSTNSLASANISEQATSEQQEPLETFQLAEDCQLVSVNSNSEDRADNSCLVSPQLEAELVQGWLQPEYYQ